MSNVGIEMAELIALPDEEEYPIPDYREPSFIIFEWIPKENADDFDTVEILYYEGGAAEYESAYGGFLYYSIKDILPDDLEPGYYRMNGFVSDYWKDYYGEVDCDHYYDTLTKLNEDDIKEYI